MSRCKAQSARGSVFRSVIATLIASIALVLAVSATANAAIGVSAFSLSPSSTASGANPDVLVSAMRTGTAADDLRQVALKLPVGASYSVAGVATKCTAAQFSADACPASSIVGTASARVQAALLGLVLFDGDIYGTVYATSSNELGIIYRPSGLQKIFVKSPVTGSSATGVTLTVGEYKRTSSLAVLFPVDLTINRVGFLLKGTSGAVQLYTNPTNCGPATSTIAFAPFVGATATGTSSYTVTGCTTPDTTPPPAPSATGPSGVVGSTSATISFTDAEAGVTFECSNNGAAFAACTSPVSLTSLPQGARTFAVRAKDGASPANTSGASTINWTVDTTPPPAPNISGPSGIVGSASAAITFDDTEAEVTFECSDNGAAYSACTSPVNLSSLGEGARTFAVRTKDGATPANTGGASTISWIVDTVAPPAPSVSGPSGVVGSSSAVITFTDTEAAVTFECSRDGGLYAACTSPVNLTGLTDGAHSYAVRAKDGATPANTSASTTINWDAAIEPPPAPSVSGPSGIVGSTSATISFTDADAGVTFECSNNGAAFAACTSPVNLTALSQGAHTFAVRAKDGATPANYSGVTTIGWTVDTIAPPAPNVSGPSGVVNSTSATISFTDTEAGDTFECSNNGAAFAACTSPVNRTGLSDGARTFAVRAKDGATPANTSASTTISWTVSIGPIPAPNVSGPSGIVGSTSATISFTDTQAGVTFECSNNGAAFAACTSPVSLTALPQGARSFAVRAKDGAGNTSSSTTISWIVDTVPPPAPNVVGPTGTVTSTSATITFTDAEAGVTFQCSRDGGLYAACTSPAILTGLFGGQHCFAVRAKDGATPANTSASTSICWFINTPPPPPGTFLDTPVAAWPDTSPQIGVSSDQLGLTYECEINESGLFTPCSPGTGTYDPSTVFLVAGTDATGTNKIAIRAKTNGVVDPSPIVTYVWIDDRTPNATATVTPSTTLAGAHPNLTSTVTLDGGYNPKSVKIDVPAGFNGGLTATSQKCEVTDAQIGECATTAPGSFIGTLTGEGVSTRDGYLTGVSGSLYLTTPPDGDTPAGVAVDMLLPNGLGHIWAVGNVKIVQIDNGSIQGETHAVIEMQNIPQRTSDLGNPFHAVRATLSLQGDPAGGTYPLLTNPTTCPATPAQFKGAGTTYADPNDDGSEGPPVPDVYIDYPVTGCSTLEFDPQVNQEFFMPSPIDGSTYDPTNPGPSLASVGSALTSNRPGYRKGQAGSVATLSMGAPSETARRASIKDTVVYMPTSIGANLPAFGDASDMCPGGAADESSIFDPSVCPAIALVGTIAIDTPLLEDDLIGNVYAINKTPIPWIGIDINPMVTPTNPVGLTLRLTGITDTANYPSCSTTEAPWCGNRVKITLANLPDVPMNGVALDLSGRTARPVREFTNDGGPAGESLPTLPLITADAGDTGCRANDQIISEFNAASPEVANDTVVQDTTMSFCFPVPPPTIERRYVNAATGVISAVNPATTNGNPIFTWTSDEPGGVTTCSINGGAFVPCASPFTPTVPNGPATLTVRVINSAGTDENRRTVPWTVDAVAPPVPTVTRTSTGSNANQIFAWSRGTAVPPNTTVGTLQCKRDAGAFGTSATAAICGTGFGTTAASGTATTSGWTTGVSHTYTIRNYDAVGNISPQATVTWAN
ncbi:MAG: hypothetical protein ACRDKE_01655 [Solirubrobacterales bacterium]